MGVKWSYWRYWVNYLFFFLEICGLWFCFCLFGFLTSSSTTRLYRGRAPRQSVWQFYVLPHMRQSWETMTSDSAGHIILTPTQPVGSGRPEWESNPEPPHQKSRILPTELSRLHVACGPQEKVMGDSEDPSGSNVFDQEKNSIEELKLASL